MTIVFETALSIISLYSVVYGFMLSILVQDAANQDIYIDDENDMSRTCFSLWEKWLERSYSHTAYVNKMKIVIDVRETSVYDKCWLVNNSLQNSFCEIEKRQLPLGDILLESDEGRPI